MRSCRPPLFRKRKFEPIVITTCVRWYCRFSLSLRDLEELMAERGLKVDHTTSGVGLRPMTEDYQNSNRRRPAWESIRLLNLNHFRVCCDFLNLQRLAESAASQ